MEKFILIPQQLFCNLCKSIGHDEHNWRSYELIMEKTPPYRVHDETHRNMIKAHLQWVEDCRDEVENQGEEPGEVMDMLFFTIVGNHATLREIVRT